MVLKIRLIKNRVLLGILSVIGLSLQAQSGLDTVSTGAGYSLEKWYSLQNDEQGSNPKNTWDLAFEVSGMGSGIHINSSIGTMLWVYPNGDTSAWNAIDTTGLSSWTPYYNSDTSWSIGAFNQGTNGDPYDLGWGKYNMITHEVTGDSIYLLKLFNNSFKKIWIQKLAGGTYYFQYADLDGNNLQSVSLSKAPYSTKNLVYYSIQGNVVLDVEPAASDWDLVFKQYTAFIPTAYNVTGVLQNKGVTAVKVYPVDTSYVQWTNHTFQTAINTIGYDWKSYSGTWQIKDSTIYFIKSKQGDIWKLVFTGFGGSSNGNFIFRKERLASTPSEASEWTLDRILLYPNPATHTLNVLLQNSTSKTLTFEVRDLTGKTLLSSQQTLPANNFTSVPISIENLPNGFYFLVLSDGIHSVTHKFIKQN